MLFLPYAVQFGKVYLADWKSPNGNKQCGVKLVRVNASTSEREDFLAEAELMLTLDSPWIVKVVTSCPLYMTRLTCTGVWRVFNTDAVAARHRVHVAS